LRILVLKEMSHTNGTYLSKIVLFNRLIVIPAQAGIQESDHHWWFWIPACAGMTVL